MSICIHSPAAMVEQLYRSISGSSESACWSELEGGLRKLVNSVAAAEGMEPRQLLYRAMEWGSRSTSVSGAFGAGYQLALQGLFGATVRGKLAAICVTEQGSTHPASMVCTATLLDDSGYELHGAKDFVSFADLAEVLLVVCKLTADSADDRAGSLHRVRLGVFAVPVDHAGVTVELLPTLPMVPEVRHGRLHLNQVKCPKSLLLSGDGYEDYVKPFRWYEDLHVLSAVTAWVLSRGVQSGWPAENMEALIAGLHDYLSLADNSADSPAAHIVFERIAQQLAEVLSPQGEHWQQVNEKLRAHWQRDAQLLKIAGKARAKRLEKARHSLFGVE